MQSYQPEQPADQIPPRRTPLGCSNLGQSSLVRAPRHVPFRPLSLSLGSALSPDGLLRQLGIESLLPHEVEGVFSHGNGGLKPWGCFEATDRHVYAPRRWVGGCVRPAPREVPSGIPPWERRTEPQRRCGDPQPALISGSPHPCREDLVGHTLVALPGIRRCELEVFGRELPEPSVHLDADETGLSRGATGVGITRSNWVPGISRNAGVLCRQLGPKTDEGVDQGGRSVGCGHWVWVA